jgi:hypothetical protein
MLSPRAPDDLLGATVEQIMRDDGHLVLTRLIRYIEERRQNQARFTGAIESDPSPLHIVWGMDDPIAVPSMVDTLRPPVPTPRSVGSKGWGTTPWSRRRNDSSPPRCWGWARLTRAGWRSRRRS